MAVDASKRMERGRILLDQSRYAQAEVELRLALAEEAHRLLALYWLAFAQSGQNKLEEAEETAARTIAADPERPEGYHIRAVVLRKKNRLAEAERVIRLCLQKGREVEYHAELAWNLISQRRAEDALEVAEQALEDSPWAVQLICARTASLIQLERLEEARKSARHALSIDPLHTFSHAQLGNVLFQLKDYDGSAGHFAEALRLDPGYAYARSELLNALRHRYWYYRALPPNNPRLWPQSIAVWLPLLMVGGTVAQSFPMLGTILLVLFLLVLSATFVRWFLGVTVGPVSTLLLRLNPIGRAALHHDEIECSDYVALLLVGGPLAIGAALLGVWQGMYAVGLLLLVMTVPVTKTFQMRGVRRTVGKACTWLLFSVGCGAIHAIASGMPAEGASVLTACIIVALLFEAVTSVVNAFLAWLPGKRDADR